MKSNFEKSHGDITSLVAKHSHISGKIDFSGELVVEGTITGDVIASSEGKSKVRVLETGKIKGNVYVPFITISGKVEGNVYCSQLLELSPKADYRGKANYYKIEMANGANFHGELQQQNSATIAKQQPTNHTNGVNGTNGTNGTNGSNSIPPTSK